MDVDAKDFFVLVDLIRMKAGCESGKAGEEAEKGNSRRV